jgi:hypothetical protein
MFNEVPDGLIFFPETICLTGNSILFAPNYWPRINKPEG